MTFTKQVTQASMDVWEKCCQAPFVREMAEGTLPREKFDFYIIQDSVYLKHYARVYAMAMYKSQTLKDIKAFYDILSFVTDGESAVRLGYLAQMGMTDDDVEKAEAHPVNKNYTDFMLSVAESSDVPEILMAVLPCMLGYNYVLTEAAKRYKGVNESPYRALLEDYTSAEYADCCRRWEKLTDEKCEQLPLERKERLSEIFRQASLHELYFWDMVYGGGR